MRPDRAAHVAIPAYDSLSVADRRRLRERSAATFLHALPVEAVAGAVTAADLDHCRDAVVRLADEAFVVRPRPFLAVYRLTEGDHVQTGLVAELDPRAVTDGVVRGHEATRTARVEDLVRYLDVVGVQSSPVSLAHADDPALDGALADVAAAPPTITVSDGDLRQDLWVVDAPASVVGLLAAAGGVDMAVITDGHHRAAATARAAGGDARPRLLVVLFPTSALQVAAFHRAVTAPLPVHPADLPAALRRAGLTVRPAAAHGGAPPRGQVRMVAADRWWDVPLPVAADGDPVEATDVGRLHTHILAPVLEMTDPRSDARLHYVPSTRPGGEVADVAGPDGAGFLLRAPTPAQLLEVAGAGRVLPPKSTFVHPKVRSGLFLVPRSTRA